jgi:hypothetical protein
MRVIIFRSLAAMLVACAFSCGVESGEPSGDAAAPATSEAVASSTGIVLCELGDGSYGSLLPYAAIDGDGDGVTLPASGEVCTDGALPPPYKAAANGLDCDDTDPAVHRVAIIYPDVDGDGVGATPRQIWCIAAAPPAGFASTGYDEDDGDPAVIEDEEADLLLLGA